LEQHQYVLLPASRSVLRGIMVLDTMVKTGKTLPINAASAVVCNKSAVRYVDEYFRLNRSAQTPAKGEIKNTGRNPATLKRGVIDPGRGLSVIRHVIAYRTIMAPKNDNACPVKKNAVFFFPLLFMIFYTLFMVSWSTGKNNPGQKMAITFRLFNAVHGCEL
jgi:hypothetical protein